MDTNINVAKILDKLNIGKSFRAFGGISLLLSIWVNNPLALKISLITFIFGALARILDMLKNILPKNTFLHVFLRLILWLIFIFFYSFLINRQIQII